MQEPVIRAVETEHGAMEYFSFGHGKRAFVILPGLSLHSVMASAGEIAQAYADFTEEYTAYVLDVPQSISEGYTIKALAEDADSALAALGVRIADVMGCSMGGVQAQHLAALRPERVRRLILASTAAQPGAFGGAVINAWAELAEKGDVRGLNRLVAQKVYSPAFLNRYAAAFSALEGQGSADEMRRFAVLARAVERENTRESLQRIRAETLVIGSWGDAVFSGEASVEIARALRCPLFLYGGYGHAVYDEAPDFKQRMLGFLME